MLACPPNQKAARPKCADFTAEFNRNSNYFGYRANDDKDLADIYVQKKGLQIDLHIKREHEPELIARASQ